MTSVNESNTDVHVTGSPASGYVAELREFLESHNVQYGSPSDMVPFAEKLSAGGNFRGEMASMVRSIILREGGNVPRAELLRMVSEAVGGADMESAAQEYVQPVRGLAAFLGDVHRSRWGVAPEEIAVSEPAASQAVAAVSQDVASPSQDTVTPSPTTPATPPQDPPASTSESEMGVPEEAGETLEEKVEREREALSHSLMGAPARWDHDVYSRAKAAEEEEGHAAQTREAEVARPAKEAPAVAYVPGREDADEQESSRAGGKRRMYWAAAAVVTVLAVAGFLWFWQRASEPNWSAPAPVVATPGGAGVPSVSEKPSAYGAPIAPGKSARKGNVAPRGYTSGPATAYSGREAVEGASRGTPARETVESAPSAETPAVATPPAPIYRVEPPPATIVRPQQPREEPASEPPQANRIGTARNFRSGRAVAGRSVRGSRTLMVSSGLMAANLVSAPKPTYPLLARMTGIEGQVIMQAVVSRDGSVAATHVLRGHRLLRGAAQSAVKRWRFRPYIFNGRPTDVATIVMVDFKK